MAGRISRIAGLRALPAVALGFAVMVAGAADTRTPVQIVEQTANAIAARVEADRQQLTDNPAELFALVDEAFLPVFDTGYAGRLILGRHGRAATTEQRREFVASFYDFLVRSYARNMLKFRRDNIQIFPPTPGQRDDPKRTVVRTKMRLEDNSTASVDYSLRSTPDGWRVFDVRIEGISYVQTYRKQFDAEISARGLDATIERLRSEAVAGDSTGQKDSAAAGSDAR